MRCCRQVPFPSVITSYSIHYTKLYENELNAEGTTIVISTHDVEALPELADRVIVVSHGSLLGRGEMHEVLQDVALLESAGLELPSIARLFTKRNNFV